MTFDTDLGSGAANPSRPRTSNLFLCLFLQSEPRLCAHALTSMPGRRRRRAPDGYSSPTMTDDRDGGGPPTPEELGV